VAFRGAVRCERCAALELGDPEPAASPQRRRIRLEHIAVAVLVAGLAATVPPWHRSGTLTSALAAWSFTLDGWAALGCLALGGAAALMLVGTVRQSRRTSIAAVGLSATSAAAIGVALGRAPGFFSSTPAPFLALVAGIAGAVLAVFALVRAPRP
jgi:hypothetical protein